MSRDVAANGAARGRLASLWDRICGIRFTFDCIRGTSHSKWYVEVDPEPMIMPVMVAMPGPMLVFVPVSMSLPARCYRFVLDENEQEIKARLGIDSFGKMAGEGSYGQVFVGTEKRSDGDVRYALKVLSKKYMCEQDRKNWYDNAHAEVNFLDTLQHPNVVHMFDHVFLGRTNINDTRSASHLVIKTEYLNSSLESLLDRAQLSPKAFVHLAKEICAGVEFIHSKFTVHHDLKSSNIMVHYDPEHPDMETQLLSVPVKIIDFGLAKQYDSADNVLESEIFVDNPFYMAPEIIRGIPYDPFKSDDFSVGVILMQILMGNEELMTSWMENHCSFFDVNVQYIDSLDYVRDVHKRILAAIIQNLLRSPDQRFSVGQFANSIPHM